MKKCMLIVDANERFDEDTPDLEEFCDDIGWIYLVCEYVDGVGVIYNGKIVFAEDEFSKFYKGVETNNETDLVEMTGICHDFFQENRQTDHYYFYMAPKDYLEDDNDGQLIRNDGFILHKDNVDYKIGYNGAHVHIYKN